MIGMCNVLKIWLMIFEKILQRVLLMSWGAAERELCRNRWQVYLVMCDMHFSS